MGPGYPEVVRGTPQMESSSRNPVVTSTHTEVAVKTDLAVRQSGKSDQDNGSKIMAPVSWGDIPDELPPDRGPTSSVSWGESSCVGESKRASGASRVSADNAETLPSCNGGFDQADTVGPPPVNHEDHNKAIHASSPIPKYNESLEATTTIVATKLSSRKEDKGPS